MPIKTTRVRGHFVNGHFKVLNFQSVGEDTLSPTLTGTPFNDHNTITQCLRLTTPPSTHTGFPYTLPLTLSS